MAKKRLQTDMTMGSPVKIILNFTIPIFHRQHVSAVLQYGGYHYCRKICRNQGACSRWECGNYYVFDSWLSAGAYGRVFRIDCSEIRRRGYGGYERKTVGTAAVLSVGITIVMTVGSMLAMKPLLMFMHTPEDIFQDAYTYIMIICAGIAASVLYNLLSGVLRALGDSKTPLYFLILSAVLNIGLDLLLILVFHMGAAGAAYATVVSQGVSGIGCLFYIAKKVPLFKASSGGFQNRGLYGKDAACHWAAYGAAVFHYCHWNYDGAVCPEYAGFHVCGSFHCCK